MYLRYVAVGSSFHRLLPWFASGGSGHGLQVLEGVAGEPDVYFEVPVMVKVWIRLSKYL